MQAANRDGRQVSSITRAEVRQASMDEVALRRTRDIAAVFLARLGWSSREIAELFRVSRDTIRDRVNRLLDRSGSKPIQWPLRRSSMSRDERQNGIRLVVRQLLDAGYNLSDISHLFHISKKTVDALTATKPTPKT